LLGLLFVPEGGSDIFHENVRLSQKYMASHPRRLHSLRCGKFDTHQKEGSNKTDKCCLSLLQCGICDPQKQGVQ
jgi:hypothetical protein